MLVTQHPVFQRFWYPIIPMNRLGDGPEAFTLLGQKMVLWRTETGAPAAVGDRCCHRTAQLSLGKVEKGELCCPYHGWQFNESGACTRVPQLSEEAPIPKTYRVEAYHCREKYGYAWVCLKEPLADIPAVPETEMPGYRVIQEFYEPWRCAGLRVMENELDLAHPTFVHTTTFGSEEHPTPDSLVIEEVPWGLHVKGLLGVANPELQKKNLKMASAETVRTLEMDWFVPFTVKLKIRYPNGLEHIIVNTMTPVNDNTSQMVQFCVRNDTEAQTPSSAVIAFDRQVTLEDKRILESTDPDVPLTMDQEQHISTDQPGIRVRRKIAALLRDREV